MGIQLKKNEVFEVLKEKIVKLEYKPGMILNEVEIATELGVSRTPVRNAFTQLEYYELIDVVPRYGAQVAQIDFIKMKSLFELTREVDPFATRLAVERITNSEIQELKEILGRLKGYNQMNDYQKAISEDERFHQVIINACGNSWVKKLLSELHVHTERLWHYGEKYFDSMDIFTRTFEKIIEAMEERDPDKAEQYAKEHIDDFVYKIKDALL